MHDDSPNLKYHASCKTAVAKQVVIPISAVRRKIALHATAMPLTGRSFL